MLDKLDGILSGDTPDRTNFLIVKEYTIEFIRLLEHFRAEGCSDKLCCLREFVNHSCIQSGKILVRRSGGSFRIGTHKPLPSGIGRLNWHLFHQTDRMERGHTFESQRLADSSTVSSEMMNNQSYLLRGLPRTSVRLKVAGFAVLHRLWN
jgi:hypothetical protein